MKLVVNTAAPTQAEIDAAQLRKLGAPGPHGSCWFTADPAVGRFARTFGPDQYRQARRQRAEGAVVGGAPPLALVVNFPACEPLNHVPDRDGIHDSTRESTRDSTPDTTHDGVHDSARDFVGLLAHEIELHNIEWGAMQMVSQIHLGGGSPTVLSDGELSDLMGLLRRAFCVARGAELSIEVDPRMASPARLRHLFSLGFNRVLFGVQEFDPAVLAAVHRLQSYESVSDLVAEARALRFEAINAELLIGMPQQTPESFRRTVTQMSALHPTRITLHPYTRPHTRAKTPASRQRPQGRIALHTLPSAEQCMQMRADAVAGFTRQGYVYLGMDEFALPTDELAVAKRLGRLRRNLQGYTTQPDSDLIALGVSAIGHIGATCTQNATTLPGYRLALAHGQLPVVRGLMLSRDDLLRSSVVMAIMCQGRVEFEAIELAHLVKVQDVLAPELQRLRALEALGLVHVNTQEIQVTDKGWFYVRAIAMVFDRHLQPHAAHPPLTRVV